MERVQDDRCDQEAGKDEEEVDRGPSPGKSVRHEMVDQDDQASQAAQSGIASEFETCAAPRPEGCEIGAGSYRILPRR